MLQCFHQRNFRQILLISYLSRSLLIWTAAPIIRNMYSTKDVWYCSEIGSMQYCIPSCSAFSERVRENLATTSKSTKHSRKHELRFRAGSNPTCGTSKIWDGKSLRQWLWLKIRLNSYRRSTIHHHQRHESCYMLIFIYI